MEGLDFCLRAVSFVYAVIAMCGTGYILFRFAKPFMRKKKGAFGIGIAYSAAMLILHFVPIEINTFAAYGIGVLSAFAVMCRIDRRNYNEKVFIAVTFFSLRWLSGHMARIITDAIYRIKTIYDVFYMPEGHMLATVLVFGGVELLDAGINFALLGFSAGYIVKTYVYKREERIFTEDMSIKEMLMLTVPSITAMTGYGIMIQYQTDSGMSWMEPISGVYNGLAFLYFGISIVTIMVMTVLFQHIKAGQEEKMQNELLAMQIDSMEKHIRQVESLYQSIRGIKHDMTNHILTLERLYAGNNRKEAMDYGKELKSALSPVAALGELDAGEIKTGNPVTDVILREFKREAEKRKIGFRIDFYYPTGTNINAFDVSVILNNALQNALENTKNCPTENLIDYPTEDATDYPSKKTTDTPTENGTDFSVENAGKSGAPHISVLSYRRNNAYMIEISNSFMGNLQWDEERGLPVTSKEKAEGHGYGQAHGYGLFNIRKVARKYSGDIAIDLKDGEFRLSIMLMME